MFTHLSDPEEKELVKKELSSRYFQHYLHISGGSQNEGKDLGASPPGEAASAEEVSGDAGRAEDEYLAELGEVGPITLTPPPSSEPAAPVSAPATEKKSRKFCFIATAAYGSYLAREVVLLQNYRDDYLARTASGRTFIRAYYRFGPYAADIIRQHNILRKLTRRLLTPIILLIKKLGKY